PGLNVGAAACGRFTVKPAVVACTRLPLVPVIVSVLLPDGVLDDVVTVKVEDPIMLTEVGLKTPVAPDGKPPTFSATVPVKPLRLPMVTVLVAVLPAVTLCELGVAEMEKSFTTRLTVVECTRLPLVPVMVSVEVF